jgi:hypothetical protein
MEIGNRFISIHATEKGYNGDLCLPKASLVYDVFAYKRLNPAVSKYREPHLLDFLPDKGKYPYYNLEMQPFESRLFFLGTEAEVKELDKQLENYHMNSFVWSWKYILPWNWK